MRRWRCFDKAEKGITIFLNRVELAQHLNCFWHQKNTFYDFAVFLKCGETFLGTFVKNQRDLKIYRGFLIPTFKFLTYFNMGWYQRILFKMMDGKAVLHYWDNECQYWRTALLTSGAAFREPLWYPIAIRQIGGYLCVFTQFKRLR
jgi:hypothetical protein